MARFDHILFVCTNERETAGTCGDCTKRGGVELLNRLKTLVAQHKLKSRVRVTRAGCLDLCAKGCAVAAFSARGAQRETWYTHLTPADADALFDSHILRGETLASKNTQVPQAAEE